MAILSRETIKERGRILEKAYKANNALYEDSISAKNSPASVFLSHKHDNKDELLGVVDVLKSLGARTYIDWQDNEMPKHTKGETARIIKHKINEMDKFILVATEDAIESKWCNWELGYGDALKYDKNKIALFPFRDSRNWSGKEYMSIYNMIEYEDGTDRNINGNTIKEGFYIYDYNKRREENIIQLTPLKKWLESN